MRKASISILAAAGMVACQTTRGPEPQSIRLDDGARLLVAVQGVEASAQGGDQGAIRDGETIHRLLRGDDGKPLFAYDLAVKRADPGSYTLVLKPSAGDAPTFAATREVTLRGEDRAVRVDLMERPSTGQKLTDVFVVARDRPMTVRSHLMALHNQFFRWIHGQ